MLQMPGAAQGSKQILWPSPIYLALLSARRELKNWLKLLEQCATCHCHLLPSGPVTVEEKLPACFIYCLFALHFPKKKECLR